MAEVEVTRPSYYHPLGKIGNRFRNKSNKGKESGESQKTTLRNEADKGRNEPPPSSSSTTNGRFWSKGSPATDVPATSSSPASAMAAALPLSPSSAAIQPTILTYQRHPQSPKATKMQSQTSSKTSVAQRPGGGGGLIEGHPAMQPSIPLKAQQRRQSLQNATAAVPTSPTKRPVQQREEQPYRLTLQGPQQQQPLRLSMHASAAPPSSQPQVRCAQPRPTQHHLMSRHPQHQAPQQQAPRYATPQFGTGGMQPRPLPHHQPQQPQPQPQSLPHAHSSHQALPTVRLTLGAPMAAVTAPPNQRQHQHLPHGMHHLGRNDGHGRRQSIGAGQCQQQHQFQHCQHHEAYADPLRHSYHGGGGGVGVGVGGTTSDGRHTVRLGDVSSSGSWTAPPPPSRHPVIHPYHNPQQHHQHEYPQHLGAMYRQPLTRDDSSSSLHNPSCHSIESGQLYLLQQLRAQDSQRSVMSMHNDHSTRSSRSSYRGPLATAHNVDAVDDPLRHSHHGGGGGTSSSRPHVLRLGHAGDGPLRQPDGHQCLSQSLHSSHDGGQRHVGNNDLQRRSSLGERVSDGSSRRVQSSGEQRPHRHTMAAAGTGPSLLGYLEGGEATPVPTSRGVARNGSSQSVQSQSSTGRRSSIGSQTSTGRRSSIGSQSSASLLGQRDRHVPSAASPAPSSHGRRAYARSLSDPYDGRPNEHAAALRAHPHSQQHLHYQSRDAPADNNGIRVYPGSPRQSPSDTRRPAINDGTRVRSINQYGPASPRRGGFNDGIRVHPGHVHGAGSTETNEAVGIYPEVIRSPTRERRRMSGDNGILVRSTAAAGVATIQLPSCPLVDYDGMPVHPGSTTTRNEGIRVGTSATPTLTPTLLDQDGIRVYSSAIQERGRSSTATPVLKPNIEARALKESPLSGATTMDQPKRIRSQSGGCLEASSTNKEKQQQVKGRRNSITTTTNPSSTRTGSRTTFV